MKKKKHKIKLSKKELYRIIAESIKRTLKRFSVKNGTKKGYLMEHTNDLPENQPDELYNFGGISAAISGLKVDIYVDQYFSYKEFNHPLWIYIRNGYHDGADFIPISVEDLKVHCKGEKINIYQQDLTEVLQFVLQYQQELYDIANEIIELSDFIKELKSNDVSHNMVVENRILLTEMSKVLSGQTGLPFCVWIGINNKGHFVGVKFPPNNAETSSNNFAEVSVPDCKVVSSQEYESWRLEYVIALIRANSNKLIELGHHPEKFDDIVNSLTKIDNECNPIAKEPEWLICGQPHFNMTKVRNKDGKFNFINDASDIICDSWFDVANDFTKNQQNIIRAYTVLNGEEGFLYLNPIRWQKIPNYY